MPSRPLSVLLDPGHGGADPGAVSEGVHEKEVALETALALGARLFERRRPGGHSPPSWPAWHAAPRGPGGAHVELTRYTDVVMSLERRVAFERGRVPTDLFVSIHANAAENPAARGFEVFTSRGITHADAAATAICEALQTAFPEVPLRADRTDHDLDREADFYVLRRTRCPAVLVELGFLTHPEDRARLADPAHRCDLAAALEAGIWAWWRAKRGGEA